MSAPVIPVSVREFARLDGCDDKLVRRAIKSGKLPVLEGGKLDPALAKTGWRKQNRRGADTADISADTRQNVRTSVRAVDVSAQLAGDEIDAAETVFAEDAENFLSNVLNGTYADTIMAERIKENALAAKHLLAARKDAGSLIDIDLARSVLFEGQRAQRDAWINFPTKVGPMLAAELGVDADKVVEVIAVHVHQQLSDLGEPEADFNE
ncbi:hypothetical protein [Sphingobium sp. Z007]|uniref:hypothetical protein n=1 Tax=Sphingobium sp. Z007 TaxID=627495 RepID=UPI000B4A2E92|nr:hypothetical protein [Sphingobium sp. Z007]